MLGALEELSQHSLNKLNMPSRGVAKENQIIRKKKMKKFRTRLAQRNQKPCLTMNQLINVM